MPKRSCLIFLLSTNIWAQSAGSAVVRGELQIEGGEAGSDYQVELADCSGGSPGVRPWMFGGSRFEFQDVVPGCKTLRVLSGAQRAIVQEVQLFADASGSPIVVRVAKPEKEPVRAETISVERLRHPIPPNVLRVIGDANRLWQAGRIVEAGEKLRPAAAKYPGIWELRLNLGVVEMKLRNVAAAAEQFSKARELEPRSRAAALDSGIALFQLCRFEEAEDAAKDAVALDPRNQIARQLLASIQAARRQPSK